jgi:hypothetical protein
VSYIAERSRAPVAIFSKLTAQELRPIMLPPHPMAELRLQALSVDFIPESAITSSATTPTFRFNPRAKPFIRGAFSHPPIAAEEKPAKYTYTHFTSSLFNPTAPTFHPKMDPFSLSPGMAHHFQQQSLHPQDLFMDQVDEVLGFQAGNQVPRSYFGQPMNFGFAPDFAPRLAPGSMDPFQPAYSYTPTQVFAAPAAPPIYALDPLHAYAYEHDGYDAYAGHDGKCSSVVPFQPKLTQDITDNLSKKKNKSKKGKKNKSKGKKGWTVAGGSAENVEASTQW